MRNLSKLLKLPESLSEYDHDNYILSLAFVNRNFFKFEVINDDLKVCSKDSGKEVFYRKNYFISNEINEYQKKSLVCDDEFELDLPLKATVGDIMHLVTIDWKYDKDYTIFGVSDAQIHTVRVIEFAGSSDTNTICKSEDVNTKEVFFLPQQLYFYTEEEANSFIEKLVASGVDCKNFYMSYEKDLKSMQYYRYRLRSPYNFNQVLSPAELRALRVSCNTSMICNRFIFTITDKNASGVVRNEATIQFKSKLCDDELGVFVDIPSDEWVIHDSSSSSDLYTFDYKGRKLSLSSVGATVNFDEVFNIVKGEV